MKRKFLVLLSILSLSTFSACGISQQEYDSLQGKLDTLQSEYDSLSTENADLKEKIEYAQSKYDSYRKKMEPYEELEASEIESRQIEADRVIAEQKAAEEAAAEELAAALAAEEAMGYETGVTYDDIARTPDDFIGMKVKFKGKVVQLIEGSPTNQIRFAINKDYDKIILCEYDSSIVESRILEDDIITIYGTSLGTISYQSTIGGQITVPAVYIDRIDQ